VDIHWPDDPEADARTFTFQLRRAQYKIWRRREGRYLLRTNLTQTDPKRLWEYYLQLVELEGAFNQAFVSPAPLQASFGLSSMFAAAPTRGASRRSCPLAART
jgi:hypothetical protein